MTMTNEEIVRDYNAAANKSRQIRILADLNMVSPDEIRAVLAQARVEGTETPKRKGRKKSQEPVQTAAEVSSRPLKTVYSPIEDILASLPEDASDYARKTAGILVTALFREYIERRLGIGEQNG